MVIELKPCPFCGDTEPDIESGVIHGDRGMYILCPTCAIAIWREDHPDVLTELVTAWNTRNG